MLQVSELGVRVERKLFLLDGYQVFLWLLGHFFIISSIYLMYSLRYFFISYPP